MKSPITGKFSVPSQKSAQDTSNWDDRGFITPNDSREVVFNRRPQGQDLVARVVNPYLEQEQRKAAKRSKNLSK